MLSYSYTCILQVWALFKKDHNSQLSIMNAGHINSLPVSGNFCRLPITFANSLDPDLACQNIVTVLDPNCLTLMFWIQTVLHSDCMPDRLF